MLVSTGWLGESDLNATCSLAGLSVRTIFSVDGASSEVAIAGDGPCCRGCKLGDATGLAKLL